MSQPKRRKNEYLAGDFIPGASPRKEETVADIVDKKINLLYDFGVLHQSKACRFDDPREDSVRTFLTAIGSPCATVESAEYAMTRALHDVIRYEKTLEEMLERR